MQAVYVERKGHPLKYVLVNKCDILDDDKEVEKSVALGQGPEPKNEELELEVLRQKYFEKFGEKPHGLKKADKLREELDSSEN